MRLGFQAVGEHQHGMGRLRKEGRGVLVGWDLGIKLTEEGFWRD